MSEDVIIFNDILGFDLRLAFASDVSATLDMWIIPGASAPSSTLILLLSLRIPESSWSIGLITVDEIMTKRRDQMLPKVQPHRSLGTIYVE